MSSVDLSLVIPCYDEESILKKNINQIFEVLDKAWFTYETIFVDDYSQDNTRKVIEEIISCHPDKKFTKIFHVRNVGRGGAVADGIRASKGKIVGFSDIDLSTHARYIPAFVMEIEKGADIATALRVYMLSWPVIPRWILTKGNRFLIRQLLRSDLKDTETGCKFFNREKILPILDEIQDTHWFWDTEIMVRSYIEGLKIIEIPSVFIRKGFYTRVKIVRDSFRHFINLIRFRQELNKIDKK